MWLIFLLENTALEHDSSLEHRDSILLIRVQELNFLQTNHRVRTFPYGTQVEKKRSKQKVGYDSDKLRACLLGFM